MRLLQGGDTQNLDGHATYREPQCRDAEKVDYYVAD